MLFTLVDPEKGYEVAYNRWYERDHFYAGCMIGPWLFAGGRWVSTRPYKDLRFPEDSPVASPVDKGSYLATYFVHKGHEAEHFEWANKQVFELYDNDRGFDQRVHAHTALYLFQSVAYRDDDPVPLELALDHNFAGLVSVHVDRAEGVKQQAFDEWFESAGRNVILDDSPVAIAASWRPIIPKTPDGQQAPMELGSGPGTKARSMQLFFCDTDPAEIWDRFEAYGAAIDESGVATAQLVAPFIPTIVGTDTYTDELF